MIHFLATSHSLHIFSISASKISKLFIQFIYLLQPMNQLKTILEIMYYF